MAAEWDVTLLWIVLYSYMILASVDLGAGCYAAYLLATHRDAPALQRLTRYLSPAWETGHFMFLVIITLYILLIFPEIRQAREAFIVPGLIVVALYIVHIALLAAVRMRPTTKVAAFACAGSGLLLAVILATALTVSEGGFLRTEGGQTALRASVLFSSFYFWAVALLAVISVLYISAMILARTMAAAGGGPALAFIRSAALFWSVPTLLASALVFVALQRHNPAHFNHTLDVAWLFLLSLVSFLVAVSMVFQDKFYGWAAFFALLQYFFAFLGYGISHLPYLIYPNVHLEARFSGASGMNAACAVAVFSLFIPLVLLAWRQKLFMRKVRSGDEG